MLRNGLTIAAGGVGLCGIPELLIVALAQSGVSDLTIYSNGGGIDDFGLGPLLAAGRVRVLLASYIGSNPALAQAMIDGRVSVDLVPQGILAERMRASGAGVPAFFTATGVGIIVDEGKETRQFDGSDYLIERAITADLAIVKAWRADPSGNLVFRKTARKFNLPAATCGRLCVAEAEDIVPMCALDPDAVHLPGVYAHRLVRGRHEKRIEHRTTRAR